MAIMHYGGLLTGRMGDKVFYIKNGKQMVRSAHAAVSNPRTPAQMRQRRLMKQAQERVVALLEEDREAMERAYREAGGMMRGKVYSTVYTWLIAREMVAIREEEMDGADMCEALAGGKVAPDGCSGDEDAEEMHQNTKGHPMGIHHNTNGR